MTSVGICLYPCLEDAQRLDAAIHAHAAMTGRTPYPAHLTLATNLMDDTDLDAAVASLAARHATLRLEPMSFLETERFTRSFALLYAPTDELNALRADALAALGAKASEFLPHVSLTYGAPPNRARLETAAMALASPIKFDALTLLRMPTQIETQADVAAFSFSPRVALRSGE